MKVGFTGSSRNLPSVQDEALGRFLAELDGEEGITMGLHGDCVGADAAFDAWCDRLGIMRHSHPGPDGPARAHCLAEAVDPPRPFLIRNHIIVDRCELLVACPRGAEVVRSGTWATIRYARKVGREIVIVWPDGRIEEEGGSA